MNQDEEKIAEHNYAKVPLLTEIFDEQTAKLPKRRQYSNMLVTITKDCPKMQQDT